MRKKMKKVLFAFAALIVLAATLRQYLNEYLCHDLK